MFRNLIAHRTRKNQLKPRIVISISKYAFLSMVLAAAGCTQKESNAESFLSKINLPESGYRLEISKSPLLYGLNYRPPEYFLARNQLYDPSAISGVGQLFKRDGSDGSPVQGSFFIFTAKLETSSGQGRDAIAEFMAYQESWILRNQEAAMQTIIVTGSGDTLHCTLAEPSMDRIHGLSISVLLGFTSAADGKSILKGKLLLRNLGFSTETLEFPLTEIQPHLKFVPKRNGAHA